LVLEVYKYASSGTVLGRMRHVLSSKPSRDTDNKYGQLVKEPCPGSDNVL